MTIYRSSSSRSTKQIAKQLAANVVAIHHVPSGRKTERGAVVIGFTGNLGAGKTTFVQGFLRALGVRKKITSPTFVLVKRYAACAARFDHLFHIDAYRLRGKQDLVAINFQEILRNPRNIVLIEWADRIRAAIPNNAAWIDFSYGEKENERVINLKI